ncbi:MAG TPA: hypothetical protein VK463_19890 [Desulfomonilaceae bacterium]|nr:hypothetical protein [Desulfomonilaceae bacterium]
MPKKKISANELLTDIRAGMDDAGLMEKYGISAKGILTVMNTLIWKGLMSPSELAERRSLAKTVFMPVLKCPACHEIHFSKQDKCPKCGHMLKNLNEKKSPFT